MQRQFTRDAGRFREGDVRDYPRETWNTIRENLGLKSIDSFSRSVEERMERREPKKTRPMRQPQGA